MQSFRANFDLGRRPRASARGHLYIYWPRRKIAATPSTEDRASRRRIVSEMQKNSRRRFRNFPPTSGPPWKHLVDDRTFLSIPCDSSPKQNATKNRAHFAQILLPSFPAGGGGRSEGSVDRGAATVRKAGIFRHRRSGAVWISIVDSQRKGQPIMKSSRFSAASLDRDWPRSLWSPVSPGCSCPRCAGARQRDARLRRQHAPIGLLRCNMPEITTSACPSSSPGPRSGLSTHR